MNASWLRKAHNKRRKGYNWQGSADSGNLLSVNFLFTERNLVKEWPICYVLYHLHATCMKEGSTRISTFECNFQAVFIGLRIQLPLIAILRWERFVSPETFRQQGAMRATVIAGQAVIFTSSFCSSSSAFSVLNVYKI